MEGFIVLLSLLVIGCVLCGPAALIISIIALNKSKAIYPKPERVERPVRKEEVAKPAEVPEERVEVKEKKPSVEVVAAAKVEAAKVEEKKKAEPGKKAETFELRVVKWILIAGVIAVIFAAAFFLKYAYDNEWIGPLGRVVIAAIGGLVALAVGEVTRRRGYGIVAKGVTALGFAILYVAVFSARVYYELIDTTPAFALAILVTAAAMLYAVSLNEIVVAFLSLLGGFLTPVLVSTGENRPIALFTYTLILGVGAMLCAFYRKWRAVNVLAFVGTFVLYTGWFEKFYRPAMRTAEGAPEQIAIALVWLGVFLGVYLVLPLLYELVKKVKAKKEDVILVLANAAVVFYYLWTILYYRIPPGACLLCSRIVRCAFGYDECSSKAMHRRPGFAACSAGDWPVFPYDSDSTIFEDVCDCNGVGRGRRYIGSDWAALPQYLDAGWSRGCAFVEFRPVDTPAADAYRSVRPGI